MKMFFSVIIPVYNVEIYLQECVNSVLNQGEQGIEIILVDDGSTDSSGKICDEFQKQYPGIIKVIHKKNEGLILTRRCGIKASKGEWIVHLDSDDYMMPGVLKAAKQMIRENDVDLLIGKVAYGAQDGKSIRELSKLPFMNGESFFGEKKGALYDQLLFGGYLNAIFQKISNRAIVDVSADYSMYKDVSIAEDVLQTMPLLENCRKAVFMDMPFVYYRTNNESMTRKKTFINASKSIFSRISVFEAEKHYLEKWHITSEKIALTYAAHCRALCRDIADMAKMTQISRKKEICSVLARLNAIPIFAEIYTIADRKKTGRLVRLCFRFIRLHWYLLALVLCKYIL